MLGEKPLESSNVGIMLDAGRHGGCRLMKTDSQNHAESMDDVCHQLLRARFIVFPKCSCIIGRIWLTLTKSLELVAFMVKAVKLFLQAAGLQGFFLQI